MCHIPPRTSQIKLASIGLGPLWMTAQNPANVPTSLTPAEFHNLVVSMFQSLQGIPYEICRAGGVNNTTIIALKPPGASESTFHPYWCPDRLKGEIKRRCTSYYLTSVGDRYIFFLKGACTTRTRMTTWKRPFLCLTGPSLCPTFHHDQAR